MECEIQILTQDSLGLSLHPSSFDPLSFRSIFYSLGIDFLLTSPARPLFMEKLQEGDRKRGKLSNNRCVAISKDMQQMNWINFTRLTLLVSHLKLESMHGNQYTMHAINVLQGDA